MGHIHDSCIRDIFVLSPYTVEFVLCNVSELRIFFTNGTVFLLFAETSEFSGSISRDLKGRITYCRRPITTTFIYRQRTLLRLLSVSALFQREPESQQVS